MDNSLGTSCRFKYLADAFVEQPIFKFISIRIAINQADFFHFFRFDWGFRIPPAVATNRQNQNAEFSPNLIYKLGNTDKVFLFL